MMRLIDADALWEEMEKLQNLDGKFANSFTNSAGHRSIEFDRLRDYIDNAPTISTRQTDWISTKDKLPAQNESVLYLTKYTSDWIFSGTFDHNAFYCHNSSAICYNIPEVTYWRSAPALPEFLEASKK